MATETSGTQKFIVHWKSFLKDDLMPTLEDFLNRPSPELQPFVVIVDVVSESVVNIRLIGTGLVELMGRELTKTNVMDVWAPDVRKLAGQACVKMITHPCGQTTERIMRTASGMMVPASTVSFPLRLRHDTNCLVGYSFTSRDTLAHRDSVYSIQRVISSAWIDIGAGVPANT